MILLMTALLLPGAVWSAGAVDDDRATRLKAAYIFQIAQLTEWPEDSFAETGDSLCIGIVGDDPNDMAGYFRGAPDLRVHGRPLRVVSFGGSEMVPAAELLHIVFFTAGTAPDTTRVWPSGVLVAGETDQFCREGGMVGFVPAGPRIRIEVNPRMVTEAGIRLSAEFLRHATLVDGVPGEVR